MSLSESAINALFCCTSNKTHIAQNVFVQSCGNFACEECVNKLGDTQQEFNCFNCNKVHPICRIKCPTIDELVNENKLDLTKLIENKCNFEQMKLNLTLQYFERFVNENIDSIKNEISQRVEMLIQDVNALNEDYIEYLDDYKDKVKKNFLDSTKKRIEDHPAVARNDIRIKEYEGLVNDLKLFVKGIDTRIPKVSLENCEGAELSKLIVGKLTIPTEFLKQTIQTVTNGNLASACEGNIKFWNVDEKKCVFSLQAHSNSISYLTLLKNGYLVSASYDRSIKVWNLDSQECLHTLCGHEGVITCVQQLTYTTVASSSQDKTIRIWNFVLQKCEFMLTSHTHGVTCIKLLNNGQLASASLDKTIKIWNLDTQECLFTLTGHFDGVTCLEQLKNGNLVTGSNDKTLKIWSLDTRKQLCSLSGHSDSITCLKLLSNGTSLVSGSIDASLKIWNLDNQKCSFTFHGHSAQIHCIEELNANQIASGSHDKKIKIWNLQKQKCVLTLKPIDATPILSLKQIS